MVELKPHGKEENSTKEILEKIAQVNKKQGLVKNPFKTRYYPLNGRSTNFQAAPPSPYFNPIANHLKASNQLEKVPLELNGRNSNFQAVPTNPYFNPVAEYLQQNPEATIYQDEEVPPGQYIKRKIIHQQSVLVPNPAFIPPQQQTVDNIKNIMENAYYQAHSPQLTRQSWQWPFGSMFPIVFKDPFTHMMNAMTTIVEYGPDAGKPKPCAKSLDEAIEENPNYPTIDIEDLLITNNPDDPVELNLTIKSNTRNDKKQVLPLTENSSKEDSSSEEKSTEERTRKEKKQDPSITEDSSSEESSDEEESDKAAGIALAQDGNKKFFSKDNTGNGIFVQRIKVRKGGVAIAGPGGIATAGSGGTAIVGPNGFAYTHPDSLAIAGSGTKVVAVDPGVNLSDIVANSTNSAGHVPRLGKIVAIGPVIYYNKG